MDCVTECFQNKELIQCINWYPVRKFWMRDGEKVEFQDDIETGQDWWKTQVTGSSQEHPGARGSKERRSHEGRSGFQVDLLATNS